MNTGTLLTRIRLEQRSLIDINKKLYELEHLLPAPAPEQFIKTAKSAALLSERSTAQLRNFLFTVCGGMPQDYYLQAAEMQGIRLNVDDDILSVRLPALLLKKTRTEGFKFLQPAIHAALKQYSQTLQMLFLKSLGYTAKEIEQRIGMPESMVHNRISRLRKKYKKDL